MLQKKSVNFGDWKQAHKEGCDSFVMLCSYSTSSDYVQRFANVPEVESAKFKDDGVYVFFKRKKEDEKSLDDGFKKLIPYSLVFFAGYLISFTITFFVMYK